MPRSGTSLIEQILAAHAAVFGAGELTFWDTAFVACKKAGLASDVGANVIPDMARVYLDRLTALSGGALRVVDKMPTNFMYAGLIHAAFPQARIIHMQRHPIDTCLSIYFQNFFNMGPYANDLDNLAYYYGEYLRISNHWRAVLPATTLLEIPYEALIEDQEGWTRRMLGFIGLPWDPKCLDFHQDGSRRYHCQQMAGSAKDQRCIGRALEKLREILGTAAAPDEPSHSPLTKSRLADRKHKPLFQNGVEGGAQAWKCRAGGLSFLDYKLRRVHTLLINNIIMGRISYEIEGSSRLSSTVGGIEK